jgi:hypothetical protein
MTSAQCRKDAVDPDGLRLRIDKTVEQLREHVRRMPSVPTLSNVAVRVFAKYPEEYGKDSEQQYPHIIAEYLTWLYVSTPDIAPLSGSATPDSAEIEHLLELLREAVDQTKSYYSQSSAGDYESNEFEMIRLNTRLQHLLVRGALHPHYLQDQLISLFDPFESELTNLVGFNVRQALAICDAIERLVNGRLVGLQVAYSKHADHGVALRNSQRRELLSRAQTIKLITPEAHRAFLLTSSDLVSAAGLERQIVERFLDRFSTLFGQQEIADGWRSVYEPLEHAPLLKLSDELWLAHLSQNVIWAIKSNFEAALNRESRIWHRYESSRSRYLESHAVGLICSTSLHARGWNRLRYVFDDGEGVREYELDGLVLVDRTAFLIEAKAGTMSDAARRGAISAIGELNQLVGGAQQQAARALRFLASREEASFSTPEGQVSIRRADLSRVYLVTVTLDSLCAFVTNLAWLNRLGILKEHELAWSVCEHDLRVITELDEGIGQFVHYLSHRLAIEKKLQTKVFAAGDELDWFGYYLMEGLRIESFKGHFKIHVLGVYTEPIADYYAHLLGFRKTPTPKPRQAMPSLMRSLIKNLERKGPPGFIDSVVVLLDQDPKERRAFEKSLKEQRYRRKRTGFALRLRNGAAVCYASTPEISQQQIDDYTKTIKRTLKSDYAVGILECTVHPKDLLVAVKRYPWTDDQGLKRSVRDLRIVGVRNF